MSTSIWFIFSNNRILQPSIKVHKFLQILTNFSLYLSNGPLILSFDTLLMITSIWEIISIKWSSVWSEVIVEGKRNEESLIRVFNQKIHFFFIHFSLIKLF